MNRCYLIVTIVSALLFIPPASAVQAASSGPQQIDIFGGKRGKVPFPHAKHQENLKDCNICHSVFPQQTDAIQKLKAEGAIKPKKVMNLQCIKCHKQDKRDGKPHGPVTCATCHIK